MTNGFLILAVVFGVVVVTIFLLVMAIRWERRHQDERQPGEALIEFLMNLWS
jgi:hypothetical protein